MEKVKSIALVYILRATKLGLEPIEAGTIISEATDVEEIFDLINWTPIEPNDVKPRGINITINYCNSNDVVVFFNDKYYVYGTGYTHAHDELWNAVEECQKELIKIYKEKF